MSRPRRARPPARARVWPRASSPTSTAGRSTSTSPASSGKAYVDALAARPAGTSSRSSQRTSTPDAVFVEDPVVVHGDLAVIARSGAPERRGEAAGVERAVRDLGLRVAHIEAPGTLDGGDVLRTGGTAYVGLGGRTNGVGIQQLAGHLREFGVRVQAVPVDAGAAPEVGVHRPARRHRRRLGTRSSTTRRRSRAYEDVPEEGGAHVVCWATATSSWRPAPRAPRRRTARAGTR